MQLNSWLQTGSSSAIADSRGIFHQDYYPHSGSYCFAGGHGVHSSSILFQRIDLLNGIQGFTTEQLDSGHLRASVSFYYQTWRDELLSDDFSKVDVTFRTDTLNILDRINTGDLHCTPNPGWCHYNNSTVLPAGTRVIYYMMFFYKKENLGYSIDAYIDDNSLIIM